MLPQGLDREVQKFEGRVEFTSEYQEKNLAGRWLWNSTKKKTNVKDAKVKGKITETAMKEVYADSSYEDKVFREAAAAAAAAANKKASDKNNSSPLPWILRGVGIATTITGVVLAVIGNNQAKDAADKGGKTVEELEKNRDDANSGQTLRNVGIGVAIVGTAGIGISFAF